MNGIFIAASLLLLNVLRPVLLCEIRVVFHAAAAAAVRIRWAIFLARFETVWTNMRGCQMCDIT